MKLRKRGFMESLESRRLLAGITVEHDGIPAVVPVGDSIEFAIRVTNKDTSANQILIESIDSPFVENVQWQRRTLGQTNFDASDLGNSTLAAIGGQGHRYQHLTSDIGDINGDGLADVAFRTSRGTNNEPRDAFVVFGSRTLVPPNVEDLDGRTGFRLTGFPSPVNTISAAGDFNGDEIDDFIVGANYILFGSKDPFPRSIDVTQLNGANGIRLDVESGFTATGAGDTNGDGLDDIVVGSTGEIHEQDGEFYVIYGRRQTTGRIDVESLDGSDGYRVTFDRPGNYGESVRGLGDVNGDGLQDIGFGSYWVTHPFVASAHILYGSTTRSSQINLSSLDVSDGFTVTVPYSYEEGDIYAQPGNVPISVASAGDMNADGIDDLIIGSPNLNDQDHYQSGTAYVVFGSRERPELVIDGESLKQGEGIIIRGHQHGGRLGSRAGFAGDLNGDAVADIMIGSRFHSYVIHGSDQDLPAEIQVADLDSLQGFTIRGTWSSAPVSDFNGDAMADLAFTTSDHQLRLLLGAPTPPLDALSEQGPISQAVVIPARSTVQYTVTGLIAPSAETSVELATRVTDDQGANSLIAEAVTRLEIVRDASLVIHDVNIPDRVRPGSMASLEFTVRNDGRLTAPQTSVSANVNSILKDVTWTRELIRPTNDVETLVEPTSDESVDLTQHDSRNLHPIGDLNGDGLADIAARTPEGVEILFGSPDLGEDYPQRDGHESFLLAVANSQQSANPPAVADVNGDDLIDLIVEGDMETLVVFGTHAPFPPTLDASQLTGENGFSIPYDEPPPQRHRPDSVGVIGDVNGDGRDDFVLRRRANLGLPGRSYIVFGSKHPEPTITFGSSPGILLQESLRLDPIGDLNSDGFIDFARYGRDRNEAEIIFGPLHFSSDGVAIPELNGSNGFLFQGAQFEIRAIDNVGDLNSDGIADLAIGAHGQGTGGSAYIVFGRKSPYLAEIRPSLLTPDLGFTVDAQPTQWLFGDSFSPAGDVNGDGVDDLLVGAHGDSPGSGLAFSGGGIVLGSRAADAQHGRMVVATRVHRGHDNVMPLGDIDYDGLDDVQLLTHEILFGDRDALDPSRDKQIFAGRSVRAQLRNIGDFNGDGFDDFLNGSRLVLKETIRTSSSHRMELRDSIDLPVGSRAVYTVTGTVERGWGPEADIVIELSTGDSRSEVAPHDNVASHTVASQKIADIDADGIVGFSDFLVIASNFLKIDASYEDGDLNGDAVVDFSDFEILRDVFGS